MPRGGRSVEGKIFMLTLSVAVVVLNIFAYMHSLYSEDPFGDAAEIRYKPSNETYVVLACAAPRRRSSSLKESTYHLPFLTPLSGAVWATKHHVTPIYVLVGDGWKDDAVLRLTKEYISKFTPKSLMIELPSHPEIPDELLARASRMFIAHMLLGSPQALNEETFVITSDVDLLLNRMLPWMLVSFDTYDVLVTDSECCDGDFQLAHVSMRLKLWRRFFPLVKGENRVPLKLSAEEFVRMVVDVLITHLNSRGVADALLDYEYDSDGPSGHADMDILTKTIFKLPTEVVVRLRIFDRFIWKRIKHESFDETKKILDFKDFTGYPSYSPENIDRTLRCFQAVFEYQPELLEEMTGLFHQLSAAYSKVLGE